MHNAKKKKILSNIKWVGIPLSRFVFKSELSFTSCVVLGKLLASLSVTSLIYKVRQQHQYH